nr:ribbon-helix-helix domain-containing protein [Candidatus Sigynarchaeum springense]
MSIRIGTELLKEMEEIAKKERMKKSDYVRKAISDAMSFSIMLRKNQTFLVDPKMMQYALEFMDDFDIEEFAIMSLKNGRSILKDYLNKNIESSIVQKYLKDKVTIITGLLTYITESILGSTGQGWFKRIHFSWNNLILSIRGTHELGLRFTKFIRYYFVHFFKIFDYCEIEGKSILIDDRIKIEFQGNDQAFDISTLMS